MGLGGINKLTTIISEIQTFQSRRIISLHIKCVLNNVSPSKRLRNGLLGRPLLRYFGGEVAFREADVLTVLGGFDDGGYLGQYTVHQEEADGGQDAVVDHADRGTEEAADQQQDAEG